MAKDVSLGLPPSGSASQPSEDDEIFGFAMTVAGAGFPDSPLYNWRPTEAERQEIIGTWRSLGVTFGGRK